MIDFKHHNSLLMLYIIKIYDGVNVDMTEFDIRSYCIRGHNVIYSWSRYNTFVFIIT